MKGDLSSGLRTYALSQPLSPSSYYGTCSSIRHHDKPPCARTGHWPYIFPSDNCMPKLWKVETLILTVWMCIGLYYARYRTQHSFVECFESFEFREPWKNQVRVQHSKSFNRPGMNNKIKDGLDWRQSIIWGFILPIDNISLIKSKHYRFDLKRRSTEGLRSP